MPPHSGSNCSEVPGGPIVNLRPRSGRRRERYITGGHNVTITNELLEGAMREVLTVARARRAALPDDAMTQALAWLERAQNTAVGNMLETARRVARRSWKRKSVRSSALARSVGVAVPCHAFLYASLLPEERRARGEIEFRFEG